MKIDREEATRIVAKVQSGETLTDDETKYLMMVAKAAIKQLPEMPGSWFLMIVASLLSNANGQGLINDLMDSVFEDKE